MDYTSFTNLRWFIGVVEEINDPQKIGRVQVRCFGVHTDVTEPNDETLIGIKTEDLPWSVPLAPTTQAAISGLGAAPCGLLKGTWVFGVSLDGDLFSTLLILGSIPTYSTQTANPDRGFNDPTYRQTIRSYPLPGREGEPDINERNRNDGSGNVNTLNNTMGTGGTTNALNSPNLPPNTAKCTDVDMNKLMNGMIMTESGGGKSTGWSFSGTSYGLCQFNIKDGSANQYIYNTPGVWEKHFPDTPKPKRPKDSKEWRTLLPVDTQTKILDDWDTSKMMGEHYLGDLLKSTNCNAELALTAYNIGLGGVDKVANSMGLSRGQLAAGLNNGTVPFSKFTSACMSKGYKYGANYANEAARYAGVKIGQWS